MVSPKKKKKYKQPKRNSYKIQNNKYGILFIDVNKLMNEMKLVAYRDGKIVYQDDADKSLINLLTKKCKPKSKYSTNATKIFNDLNMLANIPKHKSSGKSRMIGSSVMYYQDPKQLADRMKVIIGSMIAGNNSPVLKNDLSQINDELLKIGQLINHVMKNYVIVILDKMNVNRVLVFKSIDAKKENSNNKPGNFTTKFIPELILEDNKQ